MLAIAMLLMVASCSKSGDGNDLLSTVPDDAQVVVLINVQKLVKDLGSSDNNNKLELSSRVKSLLPEDADKALDLFSEGGVRLTYMVGFADSQMRSFLTGFIADEKAFRSYVEKQEGEAFHNDGDAEVCGDWTIVNDRFWFSKGDNAQQVAEYMKLNDKKSAASLDIADKIISDDYDISGWASFKQFLDGAGSVALLQGIAPSADVNMLSYSIEFKDGELVARGTFLDSKMKPVEMNEKSGFEKINMGTVKMLNGNCQMVVAAGVQGKMSQQLASQLPLKINGLDGIDGTIALAMNPSQKMGSRLPEAMMAVKMSSPEKATELGESIKGFLSSAVQVSLKGKTLLLKTSDNLNGDLKAGNHLPDLEGAFVGVVLAPSMLDNMMPGNNIPFDGASVVIKQENKEMTLCMKVYTNNKSNALVTLLKVAGALVK